MKILKGSKIERALKVVKLLEKHINPADYLVKEPEFFSAYLSAYDNGREQGFSVQFHYLHSYDSSKNFYDAYIFSESRHTDDMILYHTDSGIVWAGGSMPNDDMYGKRREFVDEVTLASCIIKEIDAKMMSRNSKIPRVGEAK